MNYSYAPVRRTARHFTHPKRYAAELTAGTGHDRFDFTIGLMIDGLPRR
jgi:hypothetical protein